MIKASKDIRGANLFRTFVHELGGPKLVANFLEVTERTVWRWLSEESAPRMAVLALYWETGYGKSLIETDQVNEIRLLYARINMMNSQFRRMKDIVIGLRKMHTGSANEAFFDDLPDFGEWTLNTWGTPPSEKRNPALTDSDDLKQFASR